MTRNLSTEWYHRCSGDKERTARKSLVESSVPALAVLKGIAEGKREELLKVRDTDYDTPAWACKQAHWNGRIEELDRLINLLGSVTDQ